MRFPNCCPDKQGFDPQSKTEVQIQRLEALLPFNGTGRLGGDIINNAVDAFDFVDDASGSFGEKIHIEMIEVRRHAINDVTARKAQTDS